ncbi:MAG: hypothetical protein ACOCYP_05390 [Planctomycetota bacterium]
MAVTLVLLSACRDADELRSLEYARPGSINGIEVLRAALADRWSVDTVPGIGTHMRDYDCAVLVCRETRLPEQAFWTWSRQWLEERDRCLVLILRDGTVTAPLCRHWSRQARTAATASSDAQQAERLRTEATALARLALQNAPRPVAIGELAHSGWLRLRGVAPVRPRQLHGTGPFPADPSPPLTLNGGCRLEAITGELEPLLADEAGVIVGLRRYGHGGRMVVCATATALLDGALVGPAAREQLDGLLRLIAQHEPTHVAWLRDHIHQSDRYLPRPTLWAIVSQPPFGLILLHVLALALLYLACRAAWLGRREAAPVDRPPRFRDHVLALGTLLRAAGDRRRVRAALARYHQRPPPDTAEDPTGELASVRQLWGARVDPHQSRPSAMEHPDA